MSSSAAIECGFAFGLNELLKTNFSKYELVKMAQKAEHEYAGVMCGIMDQFASMFGKKNEVFKLDCRSHEHEYFPLDLDNYIIALVDTRVKHSLAASAYNKRREECEIGVKILQKDNPCITALRDVTIKLLEEKKDNFEPTVFKRCKYVIEENERVNNACKFLQSNNKMGFGKLMYQSHEGLKNNYEVSCDELDFLVDLTREMKQVLGSRMMGGGFGGCTINLVEESAIDNFKDDIELAYEQKTGKKPYFYLVKTIDGVSQISKQS